VKSRVPLLEPSRPDRPRVSRETRLLLSTALLAVLALWILARVRFPDQPAATTPLQPFLTQIGTRDPFDDLAFELAGLRSRLEPLFVGQALRLRPDVAVLPIGTGSGAVGHPDVLAADPISGVSAIRADAPSAPPPAAWRPPDLQQPRYLIAAVRPAGALELEPFLAGPLTAVRSLLWPELWKLPAGAAVRAGSFVFATDARLVGAVIDLPDGRALVPAAALIAELDRLLASGPRTPGYVGVEVQSLTPALARATGATTGVVVAWVDPDGPGAAILERGDVLEAVDDEPLATQPQWSARAAAASAGHELMVRVRRGDAVRTVGLIVAPVQDAPEVDALGLGLRSLSRTGSAVIEVTAGSAADRAGLRAGDVITLVGATTAPSPAAVRRAFDRAPPGTAVLVAYTRGDAHAVTALEKP